MKRTAPPSTATCVVAAASAARSMVRTVSEIIFRIPSNKVRYGYVEVKGTHTEMGVSSPVDPEAVAKQYIWYMKQFAAAEEAAFAGKVEGPSLAAVLSLSPSALSEDEITDLVSKELHASVISSEPNAKPWSDDTNIVSSPKPWEAAAKAAPVEDDWDFG